MAHIDVLQVTDKGVVRLRYARWGGRTLKVTSLVVVAASLLSVAAGVIAGAPWLIAISGIFNAIYWSLAVIAQNRKGRLLDEELVTIAQTDTMGGGPTEPGPPAPS
jgi:hypothetical protein